MACFHFGKVSTHLFISCKGKSGGVDIMTRMIDQKEKQRLHYALKEKHEKKYMKYLSKRYGKKIAEMFSEDN